MEKHNLEKNLRTAYKYGDGGRAKALHAVKPRIEKIKLAIDTLRAIVKGATK